MLPDFWHCAQNQVPAKRTTQGRLTIKPIGSQLITGLAETWPRTCVLYSGSTKGMLRITVQGVGTLWRLQLSGKLAGAWVAEAENTWRSEPVSGSPAEIDIREVTGIDEAGRCLLRSMNEAGARFIAKGVAMEALIEEITGKPVCRSRPA